MMMDVDEAESERHAAMETDDGVGSNTTMNQGIDSPANAATTVSNENFPATSINPKGGTRRLSNKKLRKRMKLLKKAAADRAAAEALAAANQTATGVAPCPDRRNQRSRPMPSRRRRPPPRAASAPDLPGGRSPPTPAYRAEIEARKARAKKTRAVSIDVQQ